MLTANRLSERMLHIAEKIKKCSLLADIGTDHAYIPVYAVSSGLVERAVASDISEPTCVKARINVTNSGLSDRIDVRTGYGLDTIKPDEKPDCVIMAGMGGSLIISIMDKGRKIIADASQIILQPQNDTEKVRRYVHSAGLKISDEIIFNEKGKFYNIIECEKGKETYSDTEYVFGKIPLEQKMPALRDYIEKKRSVILTALENMKLQNSTNEKAYTKLRKDLKLCEEAGNVFKG